MLIFAISLELLQSWTKLVKKTMNFAHIFQSTLKKTWPGKYQTFTPPLPLTQCCFEGWMMTQPFFQRQSNIDEGEGSCVVDVSL